MSSDVAAGPAVTPLVSPDSAWQAIGQRLASLQRLVKECGRSRWLAGWQEIAELEARLDDRLVLGLVGGTGVGKSTLINALAGARISSSGDRRPTTDRIVAYRHSATALPEGLAPEDLAQPGGVHDNAELERVILLDFPDFDSFVELHHELFGRYAPLLDALLLVVDDVKYADARLYELLGSVSQSPQNLHPVLNKTDRLARRYPGEWRKVAQSILEDFSQKLSAHAGLHVEPGRMLALSAQTALNEREGGGDSATDAATDDAPGSGDFPRLLLLLQSYREQKRRLAAKELNLETQKAAFAQRLRSELLRESDAQRVRAALESFEQRSDEAMTLFARLPEAIFGFEERRTVAASFLRRGAQYVGLPLDIQWTFLSEFRLGRKRVRSATAAAGLELTDTRGKQHYRAYFETVENCRRETRLALGSIELLEAEPAGGTTTPLFERARERLQSGLASAEKRLKTRSKFWNHALPLTAVLGFVWAIAHPVIEGILARASDDGASTGGIIKDIVLAVMSALSPVSLILLVLAIVAAYVFTGLYSWLRTSYRVEGALSEAERDARAIAREFGEQRLATDRARLTGCLEERAALDAALKELEGSARVS
jgi:energy-coupling factor transporter ATP-binding protein EcfA2